MTFWKPFLLLLQLRFQNFSGNESHYYLHWHLIFLNLSLGLLQNKISSKCGSRKCSKLTPICIVLLHSSLAAFIKSIQWNVHIIFLRRFIYIVRVKNTWIVFFVDLIMYCRDSSMYCQRNVVLIAAVIETRSSPFVMLFHSNRDSTVCKQRKGHRGCF